MKVLIAVLLLGLINHSLCATTVTKSLDDVVADFTQLFVDMIECDGNQEYDDEVLQRTVETDAKVLLGKDREMADILKDLRHQLSLHEPLVVPLGKDDELEDNMNEILPRSQRSVEESNEVESEPRNIQNGGSDNSIVESGKPEGRQRRRRRRKNRNKRRNRCRTRTCIQRRRRRNQQRKRRNQNRRKNNRTKRDISEVYLNSLVAEVTGLNTIQKEGLVRVNYLNDIETMEVDVTMGPVVLNIIREDEENEYDEAQLTAKEIKGKLVIENFPFNKRVLASLKLEAPKTFSVNEDYIPGAPKVVDVNTKGLIVKKISEVAEELFAKKKRLEDKKRNE